MHPVDATAWAISVFEGLRTPTPYIRGIRNNNPGNLRPSGPGQAVDDGNYRTFNTISDGWKALTDDISYKIARHLKPADTMTKFFELYAPGADHNDPKSYAQFVCRWLTGALGKPITIDTPISEIYG